MAAIALAGCSGGPSPEELLTQARGTFAQATSSTTPQEVLDNLVKTQKTLGEIIENHGSSPEAITISSNGLNWIEMDSLDTTISRLASTVTNEAIDTTSVAGDYFLYGPIDGKIGFRLYRGSGPQPYMIDCTGTCEKLGMVSSLLAISSYSAWSNSDTLTNDRYTLTPDPTGAFPLDETLAFDEVDDSGEPYHYQWQFSGIKHSPQNGFLYRFEGTYDQENARAVEIRVVDGIATREERDGFPTLETVGIMPLSKAAADAIEALSANGGPPQRFPDEIMMQCLLEYTEQNAPGVAANAAIPSFERATAAARQAMNRAFSAPMNCTP